MGLLSRNPGQQQPQQYQPMQQPMYMQQPFQERGDVLNAQAKELDTEMQKHILNVNPLEYAFKKIFCGWREVTDESTLEIFDVKVNDQKTSIEIDPYSRSLNESGGSYLYSTLYPLIQPTATTSNVEDKRIIMMWRTTLDTINMELLSLCLYPSYLCDEPGCNYFTASITEIEKHAMKRSHEYIEINNPYDMNLRRHQGIINTCGKLYFISLKAGAGWTLEKIADTMVSQTLNRNMGMPMQQQPRSGWDILWNRGR